MYTLRDAIDMTRTHLNDTTESVWTNINIVRFINEGILIIKGTIPEYFTELEEVSDNEDVINIDDIYKQLVAIFASARCFEQDEQHYRATQKMNEFEVRRVSMEETILNSDEYEQKMEQNELEGKNSGGRIDYVTDEYYNAKHKEL